MHLEQRILGPPELEQRSRPLFERSTVDGTVHQTGA
jgi:hypothetical protein